MSNNQSMQTELLKLNVSLIEKTNFMLLTATTASIAFVLTQLKGLGWTTLIYFPMGTLILLGISFLCGCKALSIMARVLKSNANALKLNAPREFIDLAFQEVDKLIKKANTYDTFQQLAFFSAASIYATYVFLDIYLKSNPQ
ncbi:hypothetical protein I5735_16000 [Acinetobacter baumannii]|nr:hypothetical protein [Acinetobacter baumannii]